MSLSETTVDKSYAELEARAARAYELCQSGRSLKFIAEDIGEGEGKVRHLIRHYANLAASANSFPRSCKKANLVIEYLPITNAAKSRLFSESIYRIGDLAKLVDRAGWEALMSFPNFGKVTYREVRGKLESYVNDAFVELKAK